MRVEEAKILVHVVSADSMSMLIVKEMIASVFVMLMAFLKKAG